MPEPISARRRQGVSDGRVTITPLNDLEPQIDYELFESLD